MWMLSDVGHVFHATSFVLTSVVSSASTSQASSSPSLRLSVVYLSLRVLLVQHRTPFLLRSFSFFQTTEFFSGKFSKRQISTNKHTHTSSFFDLSHRFLSLIPFSFPFHLHLNCVDSPFLISLRFFLLFCLRSIL